MTEVRMQAHVWCAGKPFDEMLNKNFNVNMLKKSNPTIKFQPMHSRANATSTCNLHN